MRKLLCLLICVASVLLLITGCAAGDNRIHTEDNQNNSTLSEGLSENVFTDVIELVPSTYENVNNLDNVTMTLKEDTVTPTGLTVVFENNSEKECIFGEYFELEKSIDDVWYKVPVAIEGEYGFHSIGYPLTSGETREWEVDWNWLYGSLKRGKYRIIKDVLDLKETGNYETYYLAAEFEISVEDENDSGDKGERISSIEITRESDRKKWILVDNATVKEFLRALNNREKTNAKIDIRPKDYTVKIHFADKTKQEYALWVDEDVNIRGILMDEKSTWFINKESNPTFKKILK